MKHEKTVFDKGYRITIFWPGLPEIFSKDGDEQVIDILPDGRKYIRDTVSFCGERDEVLDAIKEIIAKWPSGIVANGEFEVNFGVRAKLDSDFEC